MEKKDNVNVIEGEIVEKEDFQGSDDSIKVSSDEKLWAAISHIGGIGGFIVPIIGGIIVPFLIWKIKSDSEFVRKSALESMNFQLSLLIYGIVCVLLMVILIGRILMTALVLFDVVMIIVATINATDGKIFRYPLNLRLIKE